MDKAARVWAKKYYGVARYIRMERSSLIYTIGKKYAYTKQYQGYPHSAGEKWWTKGKGRIPSNGRLVAYIHSHPNEPNFSVADIGIAQRNYINAYVAIPRATATTVDVKVYKKDARGRYHVSVVRRGIVFKTLSSSKKQALVNRYKKRWDKHITDGCTRSYCRNNATWPRP